LATLVQFDSVLRYVEKTETCRLAPERGMKRWPEIDALRGLMLVLMTLTHLPTRFSAPFGQPFGFVSAAEGFVFLSAFMAGYIFTRRATRDGMRAMRHAFLRRALKLYGYHVVMLVFLFTVIAAIGISTERQTIKNLISFFLQEPITAFCSSLLLIYNPPLLDILPMYVVFMVLSPWILMVGLRLSWTPIILASAAIWFCAQFGLEKEIYQAISTAAGLKVPFHQTGAFDILAWQLIWLLGLWMGAQTAGASPPFQRLPGALVAVALTIGTTGFLLRHVLGQAPFGSDTMFATLISKWHLGPLRVINFLALLLLILRFGQQLKTVIQWRFLEILGAASLPVFCVHLIAALLALAAIGDNQGSTPLWVEAVLMAASFSAMYATARMSQRRRLGRTAFTAGDGTAVNARIAR
jgi:hypothetical protein